jgi:hypothetical protein
VPFIAKEGNFSAAETARMLTGFSLGYVTCQVRAPPTPEIVQQHRKRSLSTGESSVSLTLTLTRTLTLTSRQSLAVVPRRPHYPSPPQLLSLRPCSLFPLLGNVGAPRPPRPRGQALLRTQSLRA